MTRAPLRVAVLAASAGGVLGSLARYAITDAHRILNKNTITNIAVMANHGTGKDVHERPDTRSRSDVLRGY